MEVGTTRVRLATTDEVDAAVAVWRVSNEARNSGAPTPTEAEAGVRRWMAVPEAMLLVAERNRQIVGMTVGVNGRADSGAGPAIPGLCHISLVFVVPAAWGQGIGAQLLDAMLAEARRRGYAWVQLWTQETNIRARRLYTGRQFMPTGDTAINPTGESIMRFERPL